MKKMIFMTAMTMVSTALAGGNEIFMDKFSQAQLAQLESLENSGWVIGGPKIGPKGPGTGPIVGPGGTDGEVGPGAEFIKQILESQNSAGFEMETVGNIVIDQEASVVAVLPGGSDDYIQHLKGHLPVEAIVDIRSVKAVFETETSVIAQINGGWRMITIQNSVLEKDAKLAEAVSASLETRDWIEVL